MVRLCKAEKATVKKDAKKAEARSEDGKKVFECSHCHRVSHKEDHLCKPEKAKGRH